MRPVRAPRGLRVIRVGLGRGLVPPRCRRLQAGAPRNPPGVAEQECGARPALTAQTRDGPLSSAPCRLTAARRRPAPPQRVCDPRAPRGRHSLGSVPGRAAGFSDRTSGAPGPASPRPTYNETLIQAEGAGRTASALSDEDIFTGTVCAEGGKEGDRDEHRCPHFPDGTLRQLVTPGRSEKPPGGP